MAAFICRMCGGALQLTDNSRICRCGFCSTTQSVPFIDDDDKAEICRQAEHFRREYQYDKAIELYEQLVKEYPTEADLYWALTLCRYGVEYSDKTVRLNRTQSRAITADEDYKTALKFAHTEQYPLIEQQAKHIDAQRRRIVEAACEKPSYDIYLCCLENDERGRLTSDYSIAHGLYRRLNDEGWRVFFAPVVLEDIAVSEWESDIYSALNTAKIMVVQGSLPEHFNAVWVRNVWSRFLLLAQEDNTKTIIPIFKGFSADKLPVELSAFQAIDMSKLGYENDLITSIHNSLDKIGTGTIKVSDKDDPLIRRAFIHIEDKEFNDADKLCEKLIINNPNNAQVYLLKLFIEYKVTNDDELESLDIDFSVSDNYRKAMQFGDEELRFSLREHLNKCLYRKYSNELIDAKTEAECKTVADGFRQMGDYSDAPIKSIHAEEKADGLRKEAEKKRRSDIYSICVQKLNESNSPMILEHTERSLRELGDYQNAKELADKCAEKIHLLQQETSTNKQPSENPQSLTKPVIIAAVLICTILIIIVMIFVLNNGNAVPVIDEVQQTTTTASPNNTAPVEDTKYKRYEAATEMLNSEDYDGAIAAFSALGDYLDSADMVLQARYLKALQLYENKQYDEAEPIFTVLEDYNNSRELALNCKRVKGIAYLNDGKYDEARIIFNSIDDTEMLMETSYREAMHLLDTGDTDNAINMLRHIKGYSDATDQYNRLVYAQAYDLILSGNYTEAKHLLDGISDYPDSKELRKQCSYHFACEHLNAGQYPEAISLLSELAEYSDAPQKLKQAKYNYAIELNVSEEYDQALLLLEEIGAYGDSESIKAQIRLDMLKTKYSNETFTFGSYEQDGNLSNGSEPITWIVLNNYQGKLLAISEKVLDVSSFGSRTWENSTLRSWLNNEFFNTAFSDFEKAAIASEIYYPKEYHKNGNMTQLYTHMYAQGYTDKVFILQADEIKYQLSWYGITGNPTVAVQKELSIDSTDMEWWCTSEDDFLPYSTKNGTEYSPREDFNAILGVRPAIVIDIG